VSAPVRRRGRRPPSRVLVALGGNAIQRAHDHGTWREAVRQMRRTAAALAPILAAGHELILTHGNGPQVGSMLREAELGAVEIPVPPLHVVGAESEGQIGYLIAQEVSAELARRGIGRWVVPIVSRTEVSARDPAFRRPTKPVGPFYGQREASKLAHRSGWTVREDRVRGGWRRLVPSPTPRRWLEGAAVRAMLDAGFGARCVFVVTGGGGIPVVRRGRNWEGVDAVIDKDLGAALVARTLGCDLLVIVTDVPGAAIDFGGPDQRWLGAVSARELRRYQRAGEFGEGSMGPKVHAVLDFVARAGREAVITDLASLPRALEPGAGTRVRAGDVGRGGSVPPRTAERRAFRR
jgi:carbamate kinase